jgi:hypothetical protein
MERRGDRRRGRGLAGVDGDAQIFRAVEGRASAPGVAPGPSEIEGDHANRLVPHRGPATE